ncbi:hypothetical protein RJ639_005145 [Escallonia herrerae]|uniref:Legume lectin domain-containing protein n=1 Tax=Escallonia herrerae TaxID=1293975 RepID=A0AA88W1K3_9ASTE|nr:hypothetical protein RJ639_005145 [Escallonia herrerae]
MVAGAREEISIGTANNNSFSTQQDARITDQGILLTRADYSFGRATYAEPLHLWDNASGSLADFTTHFSFIVYASNASFFADGFAFFMAPVVSRIPVEAEGSGLALANPAENSSANHFFAVEFDNFQNEWDVPLPHVEMVSFGFSSGTGQYFEENNILSWEFNSTSHVHEVYSSVGRKRRANIGFIVGLSVGILVLIGGFALVGCLWSKKRKHGDEEEELVLDMEDEFEKGSGPKKFSYRDLALATSNFADAQKLREGGFGGAYKGYLKASDSHVAIKKVSQESRLGIKEQARSRIYSFGILALEIACGRKPIDHEADESRTRIINWVWDLYGIGRILEAADTKLSGDFSEQEMERLMIIRLWCAHPNNNLRPSIKQAIHVLDFQPALPTFPAKMPEAAISATPPESSFSTSIHSTIGTTASDAS